MAEDLVLYLNRAVGMVGDNRWLQAAVAIAVGFAAATLVGLVVRVLQRLAARTRLTLDDLLLASIRRPLRVTAVLIGLGSATLLLELPGTPRFVTLGLLRTIAIVVWLVFIVKVLRFFFRMAAERPGEARFIQPATLPLFDNLVLIAVIAAGAYAVLLSWDVDVTAWLASAGILGLALSFAAKDTLANLFAGVFIMADAPYRIGDYVVLDTGERGRVTHIGLRSTRLLTRDDVEVTIPNAVMGNTKIVNETGGTDSKYRIRIPILVCYGENLEGVRNVLLQIAGSQVDICEQPEPRVRFRSFADSGVTVELLCWVDEPGRRGQVTDKLIVAIHSRFFEAGIDFPYPRREIYNLTPGQSPDAVD